MDFFSALSLDAPNAHLLVKGELDAFTATELTHRLDEAVDHGCIRYTVDTSEVTFVDAGGLAVLVRLVNVVAPFGGTVTVTATSPRFRHIAELVGLGAAFGLEPGLSDQAHQPESAAPGRDHDVPARLALVGAQPSQPATPRTVSTPARRSGSGWRSVR